MGIAPFEESLGVLWSWVTEAFQAQQTDPHKHLNTQFLVVVQAASLVLHRPKAHPYPGVQFMEALATGRKPCGEVECRTPYDSIEFHNDYSVEVELTASDLPDFVFEFLHGLGPQVARTGRQHEPEEGVTLAVGGDAGLFGTEFETQFLFEDMLHQCQRLFCLAFAGAHDDEVVGVPRETVTGLGELPVQVI